MKRLKTLIAVALLAMACSKETTSDPSVGYGSVAFDVATVSEVESSSATRATTNYTIADELLPTSADLKLSITGSYVDPETLETVEFSNQFSSVDVYNIALPYLYAGTYTATVTNSKDAATESETNACFSGSAEFTVIARDEIYTTIPVTFQNSVIRISVTDNFKSYFEQGAELTLSTESGSTLSFTYPDNSANEGKVLYVAPDTNLYLEGWGQKQNPTESYEATVSTFAKSLIGTTTAQRMSTIEVDAAYAGGSKLNITLDDTIVNIYEESIQLNPLPTVDPDDTGDTDDTIVE